MPTGNLDLKQAVGQDVAWQNGPGGFCTGRVQNLYRQEDRHIDRALRRSRRIARIPQPFEDHVGIQRVAPRNLCHGNIRCRRLNTDRPLLLVSPKPFRAPNHLKPHSVRYPKRTLSDQLSVRQGSETGRLPRNQWHGLTRFGGLRGPIRGHGPPRTSGRRFCSVLRRTSEGYLDA
jgi:hypothetical protein